MEIKIKYHNQRILKIKRFDLGDWIDLRSAEGVTIKAGEYALISLGVSMKLPDGYEAHVVPRSSTYKNFGITQTNGMGIIDNAYSGNNDIWKMPVMAHRDTEIHEGDRICQFRIVRKMPSVEFVEVDDLGMPDRGGFGITGVM